VCVGCERKNLFLLVAPHIRIMFFCVCVCIDTPGRVDCGVRAFASSSAMLAIAIHEDKGSLVYDEACEQGPEDEGIATAGRFR